MARKKKKKIPVTFLALGALIGVLVLLVAGIYLSIHLGMEEEELLATTAATEETVQMRENTYRTAAFYREDGFLRYGDADHKVGIDVSVHQGEIDWERVAADGVEFAVLRLGYRGTTAGKLYLDELFWDNLEGARAAGIELGVYFFSQARNGAEAEEEAAFVLDTLEETSLELPIFYDWEFVEPTERIPAVEDIPMTECAQAFCTAVEKAGYEAGVYFNQSYGYYYLELEKLQDYTLWLAEYNKLPTFPYHFDCLQYSEKGSVDGIEGSVDLDLFFP